MGSAGISRKRVLVCCACYVVVFIRKRLFLSLWAFCLRRIFAAQSGQYFARLLPAANVLIYTLAGGASVVVRPSGTEPVIRVMGEGDNLDVVTQVVDDVIAEIDALRQAITMNSIDLM